MGGIEKIINEIIDEAKAAAETKINNANKESAEILAKAKKDAENVKKEIIENSRLKAETTVERGRSSAELAGKKIILNTKNEIISDIIKKSLETLNNCDSQKYFDIILSTVKKYKSEKNGVLVLSKADLKNRPKDFDERLKSVSDGKITLSEKPGNFTDKGFILDFNGVEENCSFKAMFASADEKLRDLANQLLFN